MLGIRARPVDVLTDGFDLCRQRRPRCERQARARDQCDRHEVGERVVRELLETVRIDRHQEVRREEERRAVGLGVLHRLDAGAAGSADAVLDDHARRVIAAQLLADESRRDVGAAARRKRHDDAQRLRRGLRERALAKREPDRR